MSAARTARAHWTTGRPGTPLPVVGLALLAAVLRLPYLGSPLTPDEGGFLMVARQWRAGGSSLYGHYWVDRPPLLLELFRVADAGGGLTALRLIGCLAAAVTVLGVGLAIRRVGTPAAAGWAAAVACALLVSPLVGSTPVNGELLAAPFIAVGIWLTLASLADAGSRRSAWEAAGAGACAVAAVLVKQNMLDVGVFAVVLAVVSHHLVPSRRPALWRSAAWFAGGGLVAGAVVLGAAMLSGTSPGGVLFAMYPFRWRAMSVVEHGALAGRVTRLLALGTTDLLSMGPLMVVVLVVLLLGFRRARRHGQEGWVAAAAATVVLSAFGVASVVAGGSYWVHYLVQLAVPTALAAGLVVTARPRLGRTVAILVLVSAAVAWATGLNYPVAARGVEVGSAIGRAAEPGDTAVSVLGDADIVESAGLPSPYPYLWSLPARTLDPGLDGLRSLLSGPLAPTWLVVRGPATVSLLDPTHGQQTLLSHYHLVANICSHPIYLHDDVQRPAPQQLGACERTLAGGSTAPTN
jgi:hypothetical protein